MGEMPTDDVAMATETIDRNVVELDSTTVVTPAAETIAESKENGREANFGLWEAIEKEQRNLREAERALISALIKHPEWFVEDIFGLVNALKVFHEKRVADCGRILETPMMDVLGEIEVVRYR